MNHQPISCKPALWDIPMSYLNKTNDVACLKVLRKLQLKTPQRKKLIVDIDDGKPTIWEVGKNGEYWKNGKPLTDHLELLAKIGNSKVRISALHE